MEAHNIADWTEFEEWDGCLRGRICSHCKEEMLEGFCIEDGDAYYCSEDCLLKNMSQEDYDELYDDGNGDTYWTTWEDVNES